MNMVSAVTFDLWNTLFVEIRPDSCDDFRTARLGELLARLGTRRSHSDLRAAVGAATEDYRRAWAEERRYRVDESCRLILQRLGVELTDDQRRLVARIVEDPRDEAGGLCIGPVPGAHLVLRRLRSAEIRIGVVSDTGLSPGRALRRYLVELGMAAMMEPQACVFSDEVGYFKPDPRIFGRAVAALGVEPAAVLHVGDIKRSDVQGARRMGMRTVRYRGVYDDLDPNFSEADALIGSLDELLDVLALGEDSASSSGR